MTFVTHSEFPNHQRNDHAAEPVQATVEEETHLVIQILSVIAFGVFSIVAVSLAFAAFWVAGLIATVVIAGIWSGTRFFSTKKRYGGPRRQAFIDLTPPMPKPRSSGNTSFDAYRSQTLERLERESHDFDEFLDRLREARGASEFDKYLDDRAEAAQEARTLNSDDDQNA